MDPRRFDSLIHDLCEAQTRRRAMATLLAGIAGSLLPGFVAGADGKKRKGRGNGREAGNHKARRSGRGKNHSRKKQEGAAEGGSTAKDARDCRPAGHPCEGNQTCCDRDHVICVSSGPGEAARCTPCPDGQIACANACIPACRASDQCHVAGVCDPATGQCTNPKKPDGSACDDRNACTRTDTCRDGVCEGRNPVVCTASDACRLAGKCDPKTGECSNPKAPDGTACDDGDACTRSDTCRNGECVGDDPIICTASDECHEAGACDPATGTCSNPRKPNGASCNADNNSCTTGDSCQAGVCTPGAGIDCSGHGDQCNVGVCRQSDGACIMLPKADGTSCDGGNACTQNDTCQGGRCVPGASVACPAPDLCHADGVCDPETGGCVNAELPDGATCQQPFPCTADSLGCLQCLSGECLPCAGKASYCDGGIGGENRCCLGLGLTCEFTPPNTTEPGRKRCCVPDGTPCRSNETFEHIGCCGGHCNTASGTCSSTCTPVGGPCRNPTECCGVVPQCIGFGPNGIGFCA